MFIDCSTLNKLNNNNFSIQNVTNLNNILLIILL